MRAITLLLLLSAACAHRVETCNPKKARGKHSCPVTQQWRDHYRSLTERGHCGGGICIDGEHICVFRDDVVTCS